MSTPVVILTGAGSGIGLAAARLLTEQGRRVALVGRRAEPLDIAARQLPGSLAIPTDIADADTAEPLVERVLDHFGRLDALINNAGAAPMMPIHEHTPSDLRAVFAVNAIGPAALIAAVWPVFVKQDAGRIVNVSSMATSDPFPGFFGYAASKAAVEMMVTSCANEGKDFNIRAFGVAPGAVETPMLRGLFSPDQFPADKCLAPEHVARVIVDCAVGNRDADNGTTILVPSP